MTFAANTDLDPSAFVETVYCQKCSFHIFNNYTCMYH